MKFSALKHRNFRLFITGQGISLIGTWMQRVAVSWLVFRMTRSEFLLGAVGFAGQIPVLAFSSFAGVLADRWHRRRALVVTQVLSMVQAFALAALVLTGKQQVWHLVVLSIFLGIVNAFDMPIRQAFTIEMVNGKEDLGNAIALNSSLFNLTRLIGPAVAGLLIAWVGEGLCFLINGASYLAVLASLLAMVIPKRSGIAEKTTTFLHDLLEGLHYCASRVMIRTVLLMLVVISFMGLPYIVLMPVFAADILKGGSHTLGFLMAASGAGALGGALLLTERWRLRHLGRIFVFCMFLFGITLAAFAFSRNLWLSMALMIATGFGSTALLAAGNTILQTLVDEPFRGRLMSFYTIALLGIAPLGSLLGGAVAGWVGAPLTVAVGGIACAFGAIFVSRRMFQIQEIVGTRKTSS